MHYQPTCQTEKTTESKLKTIAQTLRNIGEVRALLLAQITEMFPPGSEISWRILGVSFAGKVRRVHEGGIEVERLGAVANIGIRHVLDHHEIP